MVCAANTGFSHTEIGNSPASLFDFKAALQASKEAAKKQELEQKARIDSLTQAVSTPEQGASLDFSTPGDDHCLFHALAKGGLLKDIPESLTVQQLRQIALSLATPEQIRIAAATTGDQGMMAQE